MDKTSLVGEDLNAGRQFVAALEQAGLPIAVAMWFRKACSDRWMLGIATPDVQLLGPLAVIKFADDVRQTGFEDTISRDDLSYFNTSSQFFSDLPVARGAIRDGVLTIEKFSLSGTEIDKALVFHVAKDTRPSLRAPRPSGREKAGRRHRAA